MSEEAKRPLNGQGREGSPAREELPTTRDHTIAALQQKLAETEQAFALVQDQLQALAQRNVTKEQALEQELTEVKKLLADRERQLSAYVKEVQHYAQDTASLTQWIKQLDRGFASVINSKQWRLGRALISLYRKICFKPPLPQPHDFLKNLQEKVRTWQTAFDRRTLVARTAMKLNERDARGGIEPGSRGLFPPRRVRLHKAQEPVTPSVLEPEKISLIVLNRNGAVHLRNLLTSFVAHNTYRNVEWLVVDHASSDSSLSVLQAWQSRVSLDIIACETNYSFSYSNNQAAKKARGDYLLFLNNDIIFDDDVLPLLLTRLQANASQVGLVGIQLVYPAHHATSPQQIQHLGVKFSENIPHAFYRPYELGVKAQEHFPTTISESVPAITAAALLCRREEFLSIGGFCEDYVYGYEDVDLCLSYWARLKKGSRCVTDTWLIHDESATRRLDNSEERDARMRNNREILQKRYGYAIKKAVQLDMLRGTHFWTDAGAVVAFAVSETHEQIEIGDSRTALEFALACVARCDWQLQLLVRDHDWYDLNGIDVLIVMTDSYDLSRIVGAKPTLVTIAWLRDGFERWEQMPGFDDYAIYLCSSREESQFLEERHGKQPHLLRPTTDEQWAAQLQSILVDVRDHKFRIAMKVPVPRREVAHEGDEYHVALALKRAFVKQGHAVRIDRLPEWDTSRGFGDDVVLVLRSLSQYVPKPGQLNLLWNISHPDTVSAEEYEQYDHVFVASSDYAERLRSTVKTPVSALLQDLGPALFYPDAENQVTIMLEVIAALDRRKRFDVEEPSLASGVAPQEEFQL